MIAVIVNNAFARAEQASAYVAQPVVEEMDPEPVPTCQVNLKGKSKGKPQFVGPLLVTSILSGGGTIIATPMAHFIAKSPHVSLTRTHTWEALARLPGLKCALGLCFRLMCNLPEAPENCRFFFNPTEGRQVRSTSPNESIQSGGLWLYAHFSQAAKPKNRPHLSKIWLFSRGSGHVTTTHRSCLRKLF